jgi:Domain of unknown function (DUF397)
MSTDDNALSMNWRKATYSNGTGACVEAGNAPGVVLVRDTTMNGRGLVLRVGPHAWTQFTGSLK